MQTLFLSCKGKQNKEKKTYGKKILERRKKKNKSDSKKKKHKKKFKKWSGKLRRNKERIRMKIIDLIFLKQSNKSNKKKIDSDEVQKKKKIKMNANQSQKRPFSKLNLDEKFVGLLKQTEEKKKNRQGRNLKATQRKEYSRH